MAATRKIQVQYSSKIDSMVDYINRYLEKDLDQATLKRTRHGIADFCYGYSENFCQEFYQKLGLKGKPKVLSPGRPKKILNEFVGYLSKLDGESVFLLRDTHIVLKQYQQKTKKGFGILVNRNFLTNNNNEQDYFTLIEVVYNSLNHSKTFEQFIGRYLKSFRTLIKTNPHFKEKARQIYQYVDAHANNKRLIFVDLGFQLTFDLFCYASIKTYSKNQLQPDICCLSVYPWLRQIFQGKYYTDHNEVVLRLEIEAIKKYYQDLSQKSAGALVGFAIGDSLGFPVAGINLPDLPKFIKLPITNYQNSPKHPFFSHLQKGQYTDNTVLLILTAEHILRHNGFAVQDYTNDLIGWVNNILKNKHNESWAGPTALKAALKLKEGIDFRLAGSTTTDSCSSTYRVVPLGIYYRYLYRDDRQKLTDLTETCGMITHNSPISKTGTVLIALILANVMHSDLPETAVRSSIRVIQKSKQNKILLDRVEMALELSKSKTDQFSRKYFGTGSPMVQTLPLAIFYFIKYQNTFAKGILAAANSFRNDSHQEKKRLKDLRWLEQLQEADGGNTDGIAGLTGAFLGAHLGIQNIPKRFLAVEDYKKLEHLGESLIQKYE